MSAPPASRPPTPFDLDPAAWQRLRVLLDEALALPVTARAAWLAGLPPADAVLRERLAALLDHADAGADDRLATLPKFTATAPDASATGTPPADGHPTIVGPYRLIELLGRGGMGSVWLAERTDQLKRRQVALKLPHAAWRHPGLAERLAREAEILATLEHPHIARLYDAGIGPDGQPYLALERIDGERLDRHVQMRRLGLRERLGLFLQVVRAVAYAHSRLVVHRDLKPANILVTRDGEVKLLDFGIAKLLGSEGADLTALTREGTAALTPDYAAPEQVLGQPITTAADVYALGVVLYELLCDQRPYRLDRASTGALEEAILRAEPARPSERVTDRRLRRALAGDLDTVVLKALKKAPAERYATVDAFGEDLQRWLDGEPVQARPDSRWYRLRKFVARHALAVASGTAIAVSLFAGAGVALWQAHAARAEARRAEEVKSFIASIFREADPYRDSGRAVSAAQLLRDARQRVDAVQDPRSRLELLGVVGDSLLSLDDTDAAEQIVTRVLAEAAPQLGEHDRLTQQARLLAAKVDRFRGRTDAMAGQLERLRPHLDRAEARPEDRLEFLELETHLAIDQGDAPRALDRSARAQALARVTWGEDDARTVAMEALNALAHEYSDQPAARALQVAAAALQACLTHYRAQPLHPRCIDARQVHGRALARAGEVRRGVAELETAADQTVQVFGAESKTAAFVLGNLARYQRAIGKVEEALANSQRSLAVHQRTAQPDSFTVLGGLTARGVILLAARRPEAAARDLADAANGLSRLFGPDHEETAIARYHLGLALAMLGRHAEARTELDAALDTYRRHFSEPVFKPERPLIADARAWRLQGRLQEAQARLDEARDKLGATPAPADAAPLRAEQALLQIAQGRWSEALTAAREAEALYDALQVLPCPVRAEIDLAIGRAQLGLGHVPQALTALQRTDAFWRGFDARHTDAAEAARWLADARRVAGGAAPAVARRP